MADKAALPKVADDSIRDTYDAKVKAADAKIAADRAVNAKLENISAKAAAAKKADESYNATIWAA